MKNFLQVNRALRAKKNFNFNFKSLLVLGIALITCINTAWGDVVWQSVMQSSMTGVASTAFGKNTDSWVTNLSLAWAPDYTKAYLSAGTSSALTITFSSPLELKEGNVIRVYLGTSASSRTFSLYLNDDEDAVASLTAIQTSPGVLEYELPDDVTLSSFKVTCPGSNGYLFKTVIFGDKPSTGETTISYFFT